MSSNLHNWETAPYWPWQKIGSLFWRIKKKGVENFPGGRVTKIPHSQCRGPWVKSLVRELDPACHSEDPAQPNK